MVLQLATSRVQVCSSRGNKARCIEQAQVMEILNITFIKFNIQ